VRSGSARVTSTVAGSVDGLSIGSAVASVQNMSDATAIAGTTHLSALIGSLLTHTASVALRRLPVFAGLAAHAVIVADRMVVLARPRRMGECHVPRRKTSEGMRRMPGERLSVVVTRRLPEAVETRMKELFDVELNESDTPMSKPELVSAMNRADVLVPCIADRIDAGMLGQAGDKLKLIANYGAGVDHIDVSTARQRGILVSNTPGVMTDDTADMVMALMLSVLRRLPEGMAVMQEGNWAGWAPTAFMGGRVGGKRLGILGMGRIGQAVARRAQVFGMQVHYHNRRRLHPETEAELEATYWESLDQMIARMDVISVNCPHTPSTFHLMNARRLKLMKKDAVIVNTSRGEVIDENALTRMLRSGEIAGAGLDVFEKGREVNPRLRELPNVVLLPHMGSATREGRTEMGEKVIINIKTFADGHRPPDMVVPSML
jgi:glyoxylate reductase